MSEGCGFVGVRVINKLGTCNKVRIVSIDGEARAGSDFQKVDSILSFSKGETLKIVRVKILNDETWEPDEDFFVRLLDPVTGKNLLGHDTRTRITIVDDDTKHPMFGFSRLHYQVMESWESVKIEVLNKKLKACKVNVYTMDGAGTAKAGLDYESINEVLHFESGERCKYVEVKIHDDDEVEPDEDFYVKLRDAYS